MILLFIELIFLTSLYKNKGTGTTAIYDFEFPDKFYKKQNISYVAYGSNYSSKELSDIYLEMKNQGKTWKDFFDLYKYEFFLVTILFSEYEKYVVEIENNYHCSSIRTLIIKFFYDVDPIFIKRNNQF